MNFKSSIVDFTRKAIYAKHFPHSVFPPRLHCFEIEITTVSISLSISLFSLSRKWWQSTAENWKHIFVFEVSEMWKLLNHDDNSWRFKSLVWGRGKMREFRCDGVAGNWVFPHEVNALLSQKIRRVKWNLSKKFSRCCNQLKVVRCRSLSTGITLGYVRR